jgi:hypothetical protein
MSLDIYNLHPGQKIKYLARNGTDHQLKQYEALGLNTDEIYTVGRFVVENWSTDIYLEGYSNHPFNSVCFEEIE